MLHPLTKPEQDRAFFCCNRYGLSGHGSEQPIDFTSDYLSPYSLCI